MSLCRGQPTEDHSCKSCQHVGHSSVQAQYYVRSDLSFHFPSQPSPLPLALPFTFSPLLPKALGIPRTNPWALPLAGWLLYLASTRPSQGPAPMAEDLVTSLYHRLPSQLLCLCPWAQASLSLWSPWFSQTSLKVPTSGPRTFASV